MGKITYLVGDATLPQCTGNKIIVHVCNDVNLFGAGFVLALSNKWPITKKSFHEIKPEDRKLGNVQFVSVAPDILVANMIAQRHVKSFVVDGVIVPPIRYDALRQCLQKVNVQAVSNGSTIHMPRIGCGLAGATWSKILPIIEECLTVDVYVYDFKPQIK